MSLTFLTFPESLACDAPGTAEDRFTTEAAAGLPDSGIGGPPAAPAPGECAACGGTGGPFTAEPAAPGTTSRTGPGTASCGGYESDRPLGVPFLCQAGTAALGTAEDGGFTICVED
ncbi:MAG: hypothetical protein D6725_12450 [Planctomycetota bacterium]|nr:MAG: hypothetical protein D6725_12450 [Planctomycetota bacterium]